MQLYLDVDRMQNTSYQPRQIKQFGKKTSVGPVARAVDVRSAESNLDAAEVRGPRLASCNIEGFQLVMGVESMRVVVLPREDVGRPKEEEAL